MSSLLEALKMSNQTINIEQAFGQKEQISTSMKNAINEWFARYFQRDMSEDEDPCQRLPHIIVTKICRAVFSEYSADILDKEKNDKLSWQAENLSNITAVKQEAMQSLLIGGECLLKLVPNMLGQFECSVIRRDNFFVLGRAVNGKINSVGITEKITQNGKYYTLVEKRTIQQDGFLLIENKLYRSESKEILGNAVSLAWLPQYSNLPENYTYEANVGLGLVQMRTPMVNCVDGSHDGISVFEPAIGLIRNINANEKQLNDEFELGRSRIIVSEDMLQPLGKSEKRKLVDNVFVGLESGMNDLQITAFTPTLRDESYERRKQSLLKSCENAIGLKRGILSDVESSERTATEITSTEGEYSLTVIDFQRVWFNALREWLRLCDEFGKLFLMCDYSAFNAKKSLSVSWGNGVLYDPDNEWAEMLKMVQYNMLKPEIAIAWKYDLPCDTPEDLKAIRTKYMPDMIDMLNAAGIG